MIGQDVLIDKINNLTLDTLPHSLMILGEEGSGRHTLFNHLVDKFNLPVFDITNNISQELIEEIYFKVEPYFYFIDIDCLSIREENMILKFVEEPLKNSFIVFIGKNRNTILPTVINRCQVWQMQKYSKEVLKNFSTDEYLLTICDTPGKILCCLNDRDKLQQMAELAKKILLKIDIASASNILNISDSISFSNKDNDKFNLDLFLSVLMNEIVEAIKTSPENSSVSRLVSMYVLTNKLKIEITTAAYNKQHLFERYIFSLKGVAA